MNSDKLGLYVHIPFCKSKCVYCDFCSFPDKNNDFKAYGCALKKEADLYSPRFKGRKITSVFVGGGTPSIIGGDILSDILHQVRSVFEFADDVEITVEANPDSFDEYFAGSMKAAGVNRLSLGLQSANDRLLKNLGRPHDFEDFCKAAKVAKKYFDNVNFDLMLGVEGQTLKDVRETLESVLVFSPAHLSVYGLILERGTPLYKKVKGGKVILPDSDQTADMYDLAVELLDSHGFHRYEVSNFAIDGYECRHNLNYWERGEYLGLGLAAHGYFNGVRYANVRRLENYYNKISVATRPVSFGQKISQKDACFEYVMLGLRKTAGFSVDEFKRNTGADFFDVYGKEFEKLSQQGLLCVRENCIYIPPERFYVANSILTEFVR